MKNKPFVTWPNEKHAQETVYLMPDVTATDHGSIVAFVFNSDAAREFADEQIQAEPWQYFGGALCVDARYAEDLVTGIQNDGLTVEVN